MARTSDPRARLLNYEKQYALLLERLSGIGFIWPGSIQRRMLTCGKPKCACHDDPQARHGPYIYWTTKKRSKTVSKLLSTEEADLYKEWIDNRKQLEKIVMQMKNVSQRAAAAIEQTLRTTAATKPTKAKKIRKRSA